MRFTLLGRVGRYVSYLLWLAKGQPVPAPNLYKEQLIKLLAVKYGLKTFVETGTYYGDTTHSVARFFDKLYTIELDDHLYDKAKRRFAKFE